MNKKYLTALCLMFVFHVFAQDKVTVAVSSFSGTIDGRRYYSRSYQNSPALIQSVQDDIEKSFVKTRRFVVVDRSSMSAWYDEKARQSTSDFDFSDRDLVEQGKNFGADYIVTGSVNVEQQETIGRVSAGASQAQRNYSNRNTGIAGVAANVAKNVETPERIEAIIKIIKVETGEIVASETLRGTRNQLEKRIDDFIDQNFPFSVPVIEVVNNNITLVPGADTGVKKGDVFTIYRITTVEVQGRNMTRQTEVGSATVTTLEGDFCTCRIQRGANEIRQQFDQGISLTAIKK
jgi:curli biogenesis system outer membrane secretion channel CsgG